MINDLRALYIFSKTAELGSFRSAAKALGLSPAVVSHHISQLEKRYDVALLYRSTRKLSLTHQGKTLLEVSGRINDAAQQGLDILRGQEATPSGRLSITVPAAFTRGVLFDEIAGFVRNHPQVTLDINFTDSNRDIIGEGIDLAIRVGAAKNSALKSRRIAQVSRKLVCSRHYFDSQSVPKSPAELSHWDWIMFKSVPATRKFSRKESRPVTMRFESRLWVDSTEALCQFVRAGLGLGTPPLFLVQEDLESGDLVEVLPEWHLEPLPIYGIWPSNAPRSGLTHLFMKYLVGALQRSQAK